MLHSASLLIFVLAVTIIRTTLGIQPISPFLYVTPSMSQHPLASLLGFLNPSASSAQNGATRLFSWEERQPSPIPRSEALGIGVNGKIYVFGGYNELLQATPQADVYDPATNSWQAISPMPEALTHTPLVVDGTTIWFIGGFLGDHPGPSIERVWKYDTATDTWSAGPSLPAPQGAGGAAILGRQIHFFGGTNRQNGFYSDVSYHYVLDLDQQQAGWLPLAELPRARNHLGGIALDGKIYAIGGQSAKNERETNTTQVDMYNPATNTWSQVAPMPRGLGHITASVLALNGRMLIIGGSINGGVGGLNSSYVLLYDPQRDVWLQLPSLPSGRKTPVADIIGREIYVITGEGQTRDQTWAGTLAEHWEQARELPVALGEVAGGIIANQLYLVGSGSRATLAYNLSDNSWISPTMLLERPYPGDHHAAEVIDNKLYLFGGLGSAAGKLQMYDPTTNTWSLGADIPFAASSSSSVFMNGSLYLAGGIIGTSTTNRLARYDPQQNSWNELSPMPYGRNHAAAATDGQKLYLFGGRGPGSGDSNVVANGFDTVQIYDPATDSWTTSLDAGSTIPPLPQARGGMGKAVFVQGEFYIMGGETQDGSGATAANVYDRVDIYNPTTGQWRAGTPMPTARHGIFPLLIAERIYVAGGGIQAGGSKSTLLEIYNPAPVNAPPTMTPTSSTATYTPEPSMPTATPRSQNRYFYYVPLL